MRDNRWEMILLSPKVSEEDRNIGVKKEVDGKRDGAQPEIAVRRRLAPNALLLCLVPPLVCQSSGSIISS